MELTEREQAYKEMKGLNDQEVKNRLQAQAVGLLYMAAATGYQIGVKDEDEEGGVYIFSHSVPIIPLSDHEKYFVTDQIRSLRS